MRRRAPLLFLILAVGALCVLGWDMVFAPSGDLASGDGAAGGIDAIAPLGADGERPGGAVPTLAGIGRRVEGPDGPDGGGPAALGAAEAAALAAAGNAAHVPFEGRVLGHDGSPAPGAKITLAGGSSAHVLTVDADGAFASQLEPGRYQVLIDGGESGLLMLRSYMIDGAKKDELEFRLREPGTIAVKVTRGPEGVADSAVHLASRDLGELVSGDGMTDDDGLALFEDLPPGRYEVTAQVLEGPLVRHSTWASAGAKRDVNVRVPDGTLLKGTVRSAPEGPGVAGAVITLQTRPAKTDGIFETVIETGPDGTYEVQVPRGRPQSFTVQADGWAAWPAERERRRVLKSLRGLAGKRPVSRDVVLRGGAALSGLVRTEDEQPIPGVTLRFKPRRGPHAVVTSGPDGRYALAQLNPERYDLQVESPAWFPIRGQALRVSVPGGASPSPVTLDVTLVGARKVHGVVTTGEGEPAPGARVWIVGGGRVVRSARDAGRSLETFTDAKGRWIISDIPPDKNVMVRVSMGEFEADPVPLPFEKPPPLPIVTKLTATGTLEGTVVDINTRTSVGGARVILRPDPYDGRTPKSAITNSRGEFVLRGLLPGAWKALPSRKGYLKAEAQDVTIGRGAEVRATLHLDPGAVFGGTVLDERGAPVRWARVSVSGTPDGADKPTSRRVNATAQGTFRLTGLPHGSYVLTVWQRGYRTLKSDLIRGGDERLQFILRKR